MIKTQRRGTKMKIKVRLHREKENEVVFLRILR